MRRLIGLLLVGGCASAGAPPGGEERHAPPELISVTPDSGATNVKVKSVEFRFDAVISDRPTAAATGLDQLFLISPRTGTPVVSWHRSRISVRPRNGFRPNTAYRITMLPGLADLRGNVRKESRTLLFSTGASFPQFSIPGRAFDWAGQRPAPGVYIEAITKSDTTVVYLGASDTTGQFDIGPLPSGDYLVRGVLDQNSNRTLDRNEKWDTVSVSVSDARKIVELDAIERDTLPAFIESVTRLDSVTLRVAFDKFIDPLLPLQPALFRLVRADSSQIEIAGVQWQSAFDQAQAASAADSARRADTSRAAARPPAAGARTPPPLPKPQKPPPDKGVVVKVAASAPLVPGNYVITARGFRNLLGRSRDATRTFRVERPAPRDSTARARPDSARRPPNGPPARPPR